MINYFRENRLNDINELIKLTCLKSLKTLVVSNNDFDDSPITFKPKVLKLLPWLKRINKDLVSASEGRAALKINDLGEADGEEMEYEVE